MPLILPNGLNSQLPAHIEEKETHDFCVEDDPNIRELIIYTLKTGGFEAKGFSDSISF